MVLEPRQQVKPETQHLGFLSILHHINWGLDNIHPGYSILYNDARFQEGYGEAALLQFLCCAGNVAQGSSERFSAIRLHMISF